METYSEWLDVQALTNSLIAFLPNLAAAIVILIAFWLLARWTRDPIKAVLRRADFSPALISLLVDNLYRFAVLAVGVVMAAGQVGINVTAALAGMGVAGLALGFAAQDSLANTIAGFLIFWDKPFKVGDYVDLEGKYGEVTEITLRTTRIRTRNNTYVVIPNKEIIDGVLVNHSMYGETRVDVPVGIAYKEDISKAREALLAAVRGIDGVLSEPEPAVVVKNLGASSVDLDVRVWIDEAESERPVFFRTLEASKVALDEAGIEIPFPHMQLFLDNVEQRVWNQLAESGAAAGRSQRPAEEPAAVEA